MAHVSSRLFHLRCKLGTSPGSFENIPSLVPFSLLTVYISGEKGRRHVSFRIHTNRRSSPPKCWRNHYVVRITFTSSRQNIQRTNGRHGSFRLKHGETRLPFSLLTICIDREKERRQPFARKQHGTRRLRENIGALTPS